MWISSPNTFVGKTLLSPLNGFGTLVENQLIINVRVYFLTLNSIALIYMSILNPVSHCPIHCSFVESFEIKSSNCVLLVQDCFGYSQSFTCPYQFHNWLVNFFKKGSWNFDTECIEAVDQFENYHLNNIVFQSVNTDVFPFTYILFNFFQIMFCSFWYTSLELLWLNLFLNILFILMLLKMELFP